MLQALIDTLPLPTIAIDHSERILALNPKAAELLGMNAQGRHFITALRQPAVVEAVEQCLNDETSRVAQYHTGEADRQTTFEVHVQRMAGSTTVILNFRDITHVSQTVQMRRDFVANVSHELRTPLTSLLGFIETLQGAARDDPATRDRFLDIMATEAERMNRLVGDLLSLSRVEAEARIRPTQRVNVTAILRQVVRTLTQLASENDVTLNADFGKDAVHILGDSDQLLQVFINLIENAVKYGGTGRAVDVSLSTGDLDLSLRCPAVRIIVRDYGPGIDPVHIPRLTERFYRADDHRSRALGGTGLGLAIVKHILNRHRGRLRITSTVGEGAAFTAILPLHFAQTDDQTP